MCEKRELPYGTEVKRFVAMSYVREQFRNEEYVAFVWEV